MKKKIIVLMCGVLTLFGNSLTADEITASAVLQKSADKYKALESYSDEGTIVSAMDSGAMKINIETKFSIKLKKPNLYLISWNQKACQGEQAGTVWNNGSQPYLYMGIAKSYSKMQNDEMAIAAATGISGGAAHTIPSLFLETFRNGSDYFSQLSNTKLEKSEKINGEDCYVISSGTLSDSLKVTLWISKNTFFVLQQLLVVAPANIKMPEMSDAELENAIKASGEKVTEENKEAMRAALKQRKANLKEAPSVKTTETHSKISTQPVSQKDFNFDVPQGTVLKENLLDVMTHKQH